MTDRLLHRLQKPNIITKASTAEQRRSYIWLSLHIWRVEATNTMGREVIVLEFASMRSTT